MEKLALIVEATGQRFTCLLNPEHIIVRRSAGLAQRGSTAGLVAGPHQSDFPLMRTGGGRTELELQLLFDVDLVPAPILRSHASPPPPPRRRTARRSSRRRPRPRHGHHGTSATTPVRCGTSPRTPTSRAGGCRRSGSSSARP